jgi:hypothetical protein
VSVVEETLVIPPKPGAGAGTAIFQESTFG